MERLFDIDKEHPVIFQGIDLETCTVWTDFYMADAIISSGLNPQNIRELLRFAGWGIVGTYFKYHGIVQNSVVPERVRKLMSVVKELRRTRS